MPSRDQPEFTIVGAGLGGALLACYLGRAGYAVNLHEKRADPRTGQVDAGRSINLALSTRGIRALEEVGLAEQVLKDAVPMRGRMIHPVNGDLAFQPYGTEDHHVINSVSRAGLNLALIQAAADYPGVNLCFEEKCSDIDLEGGIVELTRATTRDRRRIRGDIVVGADGAFSTVRMQMQKLDRFDYEQSYLSHGYKELTIPPAGDGGWALEKHALHIWPRGGFMMIALPNQDGSFTCTLFWPFEGPNSFAAVNTEQRILEFFEQQYPDAVPLMPTLVQDYMTNPTGSLVTVRCAPWHYQDKVVLLGDAAHAVVPFYGQGMNASFEDCTVLNQCMEQNAPSWERVFESYYELRKPHTDTLADLAIANFVEMRDHVASTAFLLKKKSGRVLHKLFPRMFIPIYSMVTFTTIPYAEAVSRAERQSRALRSVLAVFGVVIVSAILLGVFYFSTVQTTP